MIMEFSVYSYIASLILLWNHQVPFIESSINLALNKNTSQSSYNGRLYNSSNAVDGQQTYCSKFSHTGDGTSEWWQVDLGDVFEIKRIQIYSRPYYLNRQDGYAINIIKSLNPLETWQCYKDTVPGWPSKSTQSHECRRLGRYVKLSRERATNDSKGDKAVINLCELQVYGCPQGFYGNGDCNSHCSVDCIHSRCDPDNGNCEKIKCNPGSYLHADKCVPCPSGCRSNTCNAGTGECINGCNPSLYGTFCNLSCPINCSTTFCGRDNGDCFGCKTGLHGSKCDVTCPMNCKDNVCRQDNGYCTNCNTPYTGSTCTECSSGSHLHGVTCIPCSTGCLYNYCSLKNGGCLSGCKQTYYGTFCNLTCSTNCNSIICERNGNCFGCKTGFYGNKCDATCPRNCKDNICRQEKGYCTNCNYPYKGNKCTECFDGKYGENCDKECPSNCYLTKCNRMDGSCAAGCKHKNMIGSKCEEFLTSSTGTDNPTNANVGLIILGIISSINTVFIIIIILILYYKRRRRKETVYENQKVMGAPHTGTDQIDIYNPVQQQTVHYETLGLSDRGSINTNSADAYTGLNMIEARIHQNDNS